VTPLTQLYPPGWMPAEGTVISWNSVPYELMNGEWLILRHKHEFDGGDLWEEDERPTPWIV
jgi:hypothetical protein